MYETVLGVFVGVLARTIFPYLIKLKKKPNLKWDNKYLVAAISGFLISIIVTIIIYSQMNTELSFGVAFVTAYTLQSVSREVQKAFS